MNTIDKNTKEAAQILAQAQKQAVAKAKANAEYWFGRVHYAGLDVYLRLYGHEIGIYLDSNNYAQHITGLFNYICKEKELTEAEAEQVWAALRFILLGIF